MNKINVCLLLIFVMFLTSCATDRRYMMASLRKTENVAPEYKDKKTAIIVLGFSQEDLMRFENGLKSLGYNIIRNVTDCYNQNYMKRWKKRWEENIKGTDNIYFSSIECGQTIGAEFVIYVSHDGIRRQGREVRRTSDYIYYETYISETTSVNLIDASKSKWLVMEKTSPKVDILLKKFSAPQN